jgi:hypothetical protein
VVAQEGHQPAAFGQGDESVEHAAAVGAPVDVVTQGDERILRARPDRIDQGSQGGAAAVDVADGYRAPCHAPSNRLAPPSHCFDSGPPPVPGAFHEGRAAPQAGLAAHPTLAPTPCQEKWRPPRGSVVAWLGSAWQVLARGHPRAVAKTLTLEGTNP